MGKKEEYRFKDGELFFCIFRDPQGRATHVSLLVYHVFDVSNAMVGNGVHSTLDASCLVYDGGPEWHDRAWFEQSGGFPPRCVSRKWVGSAFHSCT